MIHFKPSNEEYEYITLLKPSGKSINLKAGELIKAEVVDIMPSGTVVVRLKDFHVPIKTEIPLKEDTSLLLKVLQGDVDKKIKLQLIEILPKEKGIGSSEISKLNPLEKPDIFARLLLSSVSDEALDKIVSARENIKESFKFLVSVLGETVKIENIKKENIKRIIKKTLEILNSKENYSDNGANFCKLMGLIDENFLFFPMEWDELKESFVSIKKRKNGVLFKIFLSFNDIGEVGIWLFSHLNDLSIAFFIENENFRRIVEKDLFFLKKEIANNINGEIFLNIYEKKDFKNFFKSFYDIKA